MVATFALLENDERGAAIITQVGDVNQLSVFQRDTLAQNLSQHVDKITFPPIMA
jgi:hypothetical protein